MGIGKKLAELIDQKGINANELAESTGITPSTIYSIIKRDNTKVDIEVLIRICEALDVNVEIFYQEYMKNKKTSRQTSLSPSFIDKYNAIDENGKKLVNVVLDMEYERCNATKKQPAFTFRRLSANKASAGTGFDLNNPDEWKEIEVVDTPEARQADFAVEVEGASMEPDYYDGDIVYISLASEVLIGQVGLFIQNGKGYIKEAGNGRIISRNPKYDDIYPTDGDIECKGRVIGVAELPEN